MQISSLFKTTTAADAVIDASGGETTKPAVSDFLTVQSFANFAAMSGAITAAWHAVQLLLPAASGIWFPYGCAFVWAVISILISRDGLVQRDASGSMGITVGTYAQVCFIGLINALVLASSVVGANAALAATTKQ
jgi:hypothetical protein